jgi:Zn finger protein HypA/HybF involved in hydrogenase expression
MDLHLPEKKILSPSHQGTMNLRLLGKTLNQLETRVISGTQKVRLNVGKLSVVKEKFLSTLHSQQRDILTVEDQTISNKKILIPSF